jgi:hypothetical protein
MLLAPYGGGHAEACNITGDSKTIAAAATSNGHRISVSLRHEPFSALSRICLCFLPGTGWPWASSTVIAAHGGSVLLRITSRESCTAPYAFDCFVYSNVGAAAADPALPPSLYMLPGVWLDICATGLLRCGEAEFVVAQLTVAGSMDDVMAAAAAARHIAFELRLFRHGKWCCVKRPLIIHGDRHIIIDRNQLWARWETKATVPLGNNGMLCWVDRYSGVIFSDVLDEGPNKLRYVPYPAESGVHRRERLVCTDVRGALKLVSMAPHRCSQCGCSEHDTAFDIWTLKTDDMAWVLETETNMVDSTELWALPDRPGYARTHLVYPVASTNGGVHIAASMSGGGDNVSDESEVFSEESAAPMEEENEHTRLSVSTPSDTDSIHDGLQGSNGASSASTCDQQQGDNGPSATVGRWPKRRRKANSMVIGDWPGVDRVVALK